MPKSPRPNNTKIGIWSSLNISQKMSIISTSLAGLVSVVSYIIWGVSNTQIFFYSVIISTTLAIIFDRISRFHSENQNMEYLSKFTNNSADLKYIGSSADGIDWFCKNNKGLRTVINTVYRPVSADANWFAIKLDGYYSAIRKSIDEGCYWQDIICPNVSISTSPPDIFYNSLSKKQKSLYTAHEITDTSIPLFQTTILKYADPAKDPVVSFGWGFPGSKDSRVFISSDPDTVRFFESYLESIYKSPSTKLVYAALVDDKTSDNIPNRPFLSSFLRPKSKDR